MCVGKKTVSMVPQLQPTHQKGVNHSKKHHTHHNKKNVGGDLLSHTLPGAVPSALAGLASGFGKGPGVTPPQQPPTNTTGKHTPNHNGQCAVSSQTLHNRREYQPHDQNIHFRPHKIVCYIGQLVPVTSTPHSASRSGLSTPSSPGNLKRNLISKQASRLDAFSGYPSHT